MTPTGMHSEALSYAGEKATQGKCPWVTPELMTRKTRSFDELRAGDGWVFWLEHRPDEQGRSVVVGRAPDGQYHDLTPVEAHVGTRVHEYGGGAWGAQVYGPDVLVVFSDSKRGGLWRSFNGQAAQALCAEMQPDGVRHRYADLSMQGERLVCVRDVRNTAGEEWSDLVEITADGTEICLQKGADFYMAPRLSPDGRFLAFISWQNPHMPWIETALYVADVTTSEDPLLLIGGEGTSCSVMEPVWDGTRLYALSDDAASLPLGTKDEAVRAWTPVAFEYVATQGIEGESNRSHAVTWSQHTLPQASAEIGMPAWVFGQRCCISLSEGRLLVRGVRCGQPVTLLYAPQTGWRDVLEGRTPESVPFPLGQDEDLFAWINSPAGTPPTLELGTLEADSKVEVLRRAWSLPEGVSEADIALPRTLSFEVNEGPGPLYAQFYAPASGGHCLAVEEKPPLVVIVHGGPTGQARTDLSFKVQWWTSRGFAVLDVNYRGSTGFGRAYRDALEGRWGVLDVQDCCRAVQGVIEQGLVDPKRCVIRGSSAGGLTVLSALAESDLFVAGTSLYGVTDLRGLAEETHRFEARYLDGLIAPWPEGEAVYLARSPLSWPEKITAPVLFLHGGEDRVVPLSQAEALQKRLPHSSLHIYPQEGHGFRDASVIADSLERELAFYREIFA